MTVKFLNFEKPFVIAEIGSNHEGDYDYALKLLHQAAESGADAIKFQTYEGDKLVSKVEGAERNKHFKKLTLSIEQHILLAKATVEAGKIYMSSVWDIENLDKLDPYISIHKVGSGDLTNYPFLKYLCEKNKPIILSTAMADLDEVKEAYSFVAKCNPSLAAKNQIAILHCVAMYGEPKDEYANLNSIKTLQETFPAVPIGYSDHTVGTYACELAVALGSSILELHFTDDKTRAFRDHQISATADEIRDLVGKCAKVQTLLGTAGKFPIQPIESKERIKEFRRAVYLNTDCAKGTVLTEKNLTTLRPNVGIDARRYFELINKRLIKDKKAFEALDESDFE